MEILRFQHIIIILAHSYYKGNIVIFHFLLKYLAHCRGKVIGGGWKFFFNDLAK